MDVMMWVGLVTLATIIFARTMFILFTHERNQERTIELLKQIRDRLPKSR